MLRKIFLILLLGLLFMGNLRASGYRDPENLTEGYVQELYEKLRVQDKIPYAVFRRGYYGYYRTPGKRAGILTIIDYTKPSNEPRFYVLDLAGKRLVWESYVSHGKNSGLIVPVIFSNNRNSYQSSLGFYKTLDTYRGDYGYSLRLQGLEEGFNSNVLPRKIVIHGAEYSDPSFIKDHGFLGRTNGCPALPPSVSSDIIDYIKGGTVIYVVGNDNRYLERSAYVRF